MNDESHWQRKANLGYTITVASYATLLLLILLAHIGTGFSLKLLLVQWLPLLVFVPGLYKRINYRTYSWLCFVLLLYFVGYVVDVGSPLREWSDVIGICLTVVLFISSMLTSRYMQRWQYEIYQQQITTPPPEQTQTTPNHNTDN